MEGSDIAEREKVDVYHRIGIFEDAHFLGMFEANSQLQQNQHLQSIIYRSMLFRSQ